MHRSRSLKSLPLADQKLKHQNHSLRKAQPLPLIGQKIKKSWGVDPNILKTKERVVLPAIVVTLQKQQLSKNRDAKDVQKANVKMDEFSKTTR